MDSIIHQHTVARYYCIQRLKALQQDTSWQSWVITTTLQTILNIIEQFTPSDFQSREELDAFFDVSVEMAITHLIYQQQFDYPYLIRRYKTNREDIQRLILETCDCCSFFFKQDRKTPSSVLHDRRVLTQRELQVIWEQFTQVKAILPKDTLLQGNVPLETIVRALKSRGSDLIWQLYPCFGYELASPWLLDMFACDDSYWVNREYTWYIYGEGHGYPEIAGEMLTIIHE